MFAISHLIAIRHPGGHLVRIWKSSRNLDNLLRATLELREGCLHLKSVMKALIFGIRVTPRSFNKLRFSPPCSLDSLSRISQTSVISPIFLRRVVQSWTRNSCATKRYSDFGNFRMQLRKKGLSWCWYTWCGFVSVK